MLKASGSYRKNDTPSVTFFFYLTPKWELSDPD